MDRNQAKALLPIIKAFSEGKEIQEFVKNYTVGSDRWIDVNSIDTSDKREYRIKPEPTYRPFANAEECWQEMLKHQPFGWVKGKGNRRSVLITACENDGVFMGRNEGWIFKDTLDLFTFADGTPFGVKVEE